MNNIKIYAIIGQVIYQRGKKTEEVRYNVEYVVDNIETAMEIMKEEITSCCAIGYYGYHDWKVQIRTMNVLQSGFVSHFDELIEEVNKSNYLKEQKE